jgi:acetylornithine deacetylase/succinyl-diaminopimelate desuccinylase-like protein
MDLNSFQQWYQIHKEEILSEYFQFLTFPTVGTQKKHHQDMQDCIHWLIQLIQKMGFTTEKWDFPDGQPVLFAENIIDSSLPTVLFYQHYDVQPADPVGLWISPPFEPMIRDGKVFARGAEDNKGQCHYTLTAIKAFLELTEERRFNIKVLIDGEEESGSHSLMTYGGKYKDRLEANYLLIVDMGIGSFIRPHVCIGCRGIVSMEVECVVSNTDMHSGEHGGIAANPIHILAKAISQIHDDQGKVIIDGFYEGVDVLSEEEKKEFDLSFEPEEYKREFGVRAFAQKDINPKEANTIWPVLELNGMWGGYTEEGFKTVLPAKAGCKISCRLVPNQDPEKVFSLVADFLRANVPKEVELHIKEHGHGKAYRASTNSNFAKMVKKAYENVFGQSCLYYTSGGSIPIATNLIELSGAECVFPGVGFAENNIHAPNEWFSLDQHEKGFSMLIGILMMFNIEDISCFD